MAMGNVMMQSIGSAKNVSEYMSILVRFRCT